MKLIKLSANRETFQTVEFKDGLNLIVGKQANPDDDNKKNTYNGVGKSLMIYLIHFCLASNKIQVFEDKIPEWEFTLEFELNSIIYISSRNTSNQKEIYLNGTKYSVTKFRNYMLPKVFNLEENEKSLTFNTLFPRFIRRDRECYNKYDTYLKNEQEYSKLINNSFILGIDINWIIDKKNLRDLQTSTDDLRKGLEKDPVLKQHFHNGDDAEIEMLDLQEEIKHLQEEISIFKVSKNYHEIENQADELSYSIKNIENQRVLANNCIRNIQKSLNIEPDVSRDKILNLYRQAQIEIPEMIVKKVDDVLAFHSNLLSSRKKRLFNELKKNKEVVKELDLKIVDCGKQMDERLDYLNTHGALDEYVSLNKKLGDLNIKLKSLQEYQNILKTYKKKLRDIKSDYTEKSANTEEYLESIKELLESIMTTFRELAKAFYEKPGGIKIMNNDGENTIRFDINAKIQDDSSDGVNEVKIFCFDMTLLLLQNNHNIKFLFHDSRLFSNMDPRQRYTLFKLAYEKTENEFQYIATVNEDALLSFKDMMTEEEYKNIIEDNVRLKLTDESEQSKLLGIQIDMDYEK